ncbi:NAD-dependent epimerase/dehydratase family protein [Nonomuraea sp. NPDC050556]|uniref:NAD-dependent epimerase/dehydratase family protein n=1 Tax=Nonomuraea sp. NPDC050556 TaxID=3364369 RepID=UPI0037B2B869
MRLLVLGGTHFVGRAVVEAAKERGDEVTTLNRGTSAPADITVDRTDRAALGAALGDGTWDAVIDTWSGAPSVIRDSAELLADRAGHYGYVSSRSVYTWPVPLGLDESAPVVDGDPDDTGSSDYAIAKRGGELAVLRAFGERALLARAGLVIGPYENIGRLPWWLRRIERGGQVLAPGTPDRPLQYLDARDLASWMLSAASAGLGGAYNAVSRRGHTTMGELLDLCVRVTGSDASLVWAPQGLLDELGISPWVELPIYLPDDEEYGGMHDGDVSAAFDAGLMCRPVAETVADTWAWLGREGDPKLRADRAKVGLDPDKEASALAKLA